MVGSGSDAVSLNESLIDLKILTGAVISPGYVRSDTDKNGKFGLSDVIFLLQTVAELRQ